MTMIWVYREELRTNDDLIGYDVEGSDGHIGKVDESSTESDFSHLVVDRTRRVFCRATWVTLMSRDMGDSHEGSWRRWRGLPRGWPEGWYRRVGSMRRCRTS